MRGFGSIGNVWNTIRQINVGEIRDQAQQPIRIGIVGQPEQSHAVVQALYTGPQRCYGGDYTAVEEYSMPLQQAQHTALDRCDFVIVVADTRGAATADLLTVSEALVRLAVPCLLLLVGTEEWSFARVSREVSLPNALTVTVPDTQTQTLAQRLIPALVEHLPEDQQIAAARRMPGLRELVARRLIGETSFSNATYVLASGIPQMVPLLNIPLNAADIVVLTKNQALMVYKLALAFGAPPDFQAQMKEIMPVIGSGFIWRQAARQLVGLVPGFGIAPKVAVAYAGTYATGQVAAQWYRSGEQLSGEALRGVYRQAAELGRQRARELVRRQHPTTEQTENPAAPTEPASPRRRFWPFRRS